MNEEKIFWEKKLMKFERAIIFKIDSWKKIYDQLSNWSVGIDLHIGELERKYNLFYDLYLKRIAQLQKEINELGERVRDATREGR